MDFTLSEDQQMLMTAFERLLSNYRAAPHGHHGFVCYSADFQQELRESGFLEIASQPGFGLLEAALLVEEAATCPISVEAAASMMIGPLVGDVTGPVAMAWRSGMPVRYLAQASTVCLFYGEDVVACDPECCDIGPLDSVVAYPMARLNGVLESARPLEGISMSTIRRRAHIGIAAEAAGLMRGALENTVAYVKEREQFGQPLGHFQAIQHRLAEDTQIVRACKLLALRAAYDDSDSRAALACLYAQDAMRKVIYDCHQFSGAMGLTLEFPLHLWTYRLKVLQGEAGGRTAQARIVSRETWPVGGASFRQHTFAEGVA